MPLIPADVGLRLRLDNELQTQQVAPTKEIAADLPRLQAGQVFTAQIRDALPQNTYLALVGGKQVTLSLPENVKSGDVLELVVVEQTPKAIIAAFADPAKAGKAASPNTTLSQTGQMLRSILINEGETPEAAPLNRGQPLLANPPKNGAELAPALQKAVTQSGLFYEAHQAQWVSGKLPLANLRQEPQGQVPVPGQTTLANQAAQPAPASVAQPALTQAGALPLAASAQAAAPFTTPATPGAGMPMPAPGTPATAAQTSPGGLPAAALPQTTTPPTLPTPAPLNNGVMQSLLLYQNNQAQSPASPEQASNSTQNSLHAPPGAHATQTSSAADQPAAGSLAAQSTPATPSDEATRNNAHASTLASTQMKPMPALPDELRTLVQQQLDAAGTQRLLWHGEVWPQQQMHWQLEWQNQGSGNNAEDPEPWQTTLRLSTPRLGTLEAALHLGPAGVRIALNTDTDPSASVMRAHAAELESALSAAGVPLRGFSVRHTPTESDEGEP